MPNSFPEAPIRTLAFDEEAYPARLRDLRDAPKRVYVRGTVLTAEPPAVAIVGTRDASPYGLRVTRAIAAACARAGVCVVSGLARGIDAEAHKAALAAGGRTVAVLGTGPDVYYPRSHRSLQEAIARDGLVLSEHAPGETGHRGAFPRRNRLIAALADITVVVEAGEGSGALITSTQAVALGRTVACVPNAIDVPTARGSNALLKDSAEPILAPDDVLALLDMRSSPAHGPVLDGEAARCWDALCQGASDVPAIAQLTGLPGRQITALVAMLEIDGLVTFDAAGRVFPAVGLG